MVRPSAWCTSASTDQPTNNQSIDPIHSVSWAVSLLGGTTLQSFGKVILIGEWNQRQKFTIYYNSLIGYNRCSSLHSG
jgi:hypothetical protein